MGYNKMYEIDFKPSSLITDFVLVGDSRSDSPALRETLVHPLRQVDCIKAYDRKSVTSTMLCASEHGHDSCQASSFVILVVV